MDQGNGNQWLSLNHQTLSWKPSKASLEQTCQISKHPRDKFLLQLIFCVKISTKTELSEKFKKKTILKHKNSIELS